MDIDGKTCLVTGADSGIGKHASIKLAQKGAHVVMLCRDIEKAQEARQEIIKESGNPDVGLIICDLSLMRSIREAVEEFKERLDDLHVLINNAGVLLPEREITDEGNEKSFAVNYLGPFLLTNLLLDVIKKNTPARIVNITSAMHTRGSIDFDDLQMKKGRYSGWRAYANSKLAMVMFTYELAEKLVNEEITVNTLHPGAVSTNFGEESIGTKAIYDIFGFLMRDPGEAAEDVVHLASSDQLEGVTGEYFEKEDMADSLDESYDEEKRKKLWEVTEKLVGLKQT
jgi:NAD(P)-dependent dehydrogenase (short-subunit alcohol dehydrogenase family)